MTYTLDYFIDKFEGIPDSKWCVYNFTENGKMCALGHCGQRNDTSTAQANTLKKLAPYIIDANDAMMKSFRQPTPKARVLAYLKYLKEKKE